jgi:hypothetical protein
MLSAIEEEGHHGERYPATNENDPGKQHQLAWDGPNTGTLHQLGQTRYRHRVDRDLTVIGERLNAEDPYVITAQPPPDGAGKGDVMTRLDIISR